MRAQALKLRFLPIAIATTSLAALLMLIPTNPASAHDELVSSDPAAGSSVQTLPDELTMTFSAALIDSDGGTAVVVMDAAGNDVTAGAPEIDGAVLIQPLDAGAGTAGEYTVVWQVVSSDGHPTDGEFTFTATEAAQAPAETTSPHATETATPAETSSATPDAAAPETRDTDAPAAAWIWPVAILGILVVAGVLTWLIIRSRRGGADSDSDVSAEG
ncbi:copper resistance protein CopC [Microbacterium sp. NPDC056234]|uniref:copper resistance CopC family protein n=1 Tax=Microbacterium sp. NPDC056234 TaxID=3345757 RepID=UPI0035DBDFFE